MVFLRGLLGGYKMSKKNLEETIKEKVAVLLEETMEKSWGIAIPKVESDITDRLQNPLPMKFYVPSSSFQEAKTKFKVEFLKTQLRLHRGNISQSAKFLGLDRRSIHRVVKDLGITIEKNKEQAEVNDNDQEHFIDRAIRSTLDQYKEIIQPQKMEKIYQEVPALSRNIAKILPHYHFTWRQAEREFEKQFISEALKEYGWKIAETARRINLRPETLHRKVKKLGLKKEL